MLSFSVAGIVCVTRRWKTSRRHADANTCPFSQYKRDCLFLSLVVPFVLGKRDRYSVSVSATVALFPKPFLTKSNWNGHTPFLFTIAHFSIDFIEKARGNRWATMRLVDFLPTYSPNKNSNKWAGNFLLLCSLMTSPLLLFYWADQWEGVVDKVSGAVRILQ